MNAQYQWGKILMAGKWVERNEAEAVKWFKKAAKQGQAEAMFALSKLYLAGRGVAVDMDKAMEWRRKAAEHGHGEARVGL
jgi:uncharacterized protein